MNQKNHSHFVRISSSVTHRFRYRNQNLWKHENRDLKTRIYGQNKIEVLEFEGLPHDSQRRWDSVDQSYRATRFWTEIVEN